LAGRDAHAGLQPHLGAGLEPTDRLDQLKPGAHRPLGIVLVRFRPAEVGEHPVAQELGKVSLEPADDIRAGRLIAPHHLAQILGIEPRRQLGRADEVAEQHGQLAALGSAR
jgi:hypothetical protein